MDLKCQTSLTFQSKFIQFNRRSFLNSRATKPQEKKSALLLIIETYFYCWQHPTAPRMITWPTTAHRTQTRENSHLHQFRAAQKQWERKSIYKHVYTEAPSSIWLERRGAFVPALTDRGTKWAQSKLDFSFSFNQSIVIWNRLFEMIC